jgi:hypothetical protein
LLVFSFFRKPPDLFVLPGIVNAPDAALLAAWAGSLLFRLLLG